jgi:uncharacterized membrane protein YgaE (UPF0421/DUF939 family)
VSDQFAEPTLGREALRRSRTSIAARFELLRDLALPIAQSALAAAAAWVIAREVIGHAKPFFAPVAAVISVGAAHGARSRRALELVVGVALGVAVGDLLVAGIGTGTWQLALVVVLAMSAAVLIGGGGGLLTVQAAVSGVLVASLQPPNGGVDFSRAVDALVGGVAALAVTAVLPAKPLTRVRRAAARVMPELAGTIVDVAEALRSRDRRVAEAALARARGLDELSADLRDEIQSGIEVVRLSPPRRASRQPLAQYEDAAPNVDLAVRNVRVLARGVLRTIDLDDPVPTSLLAALEDLAAAVRGLGDVLEHDVDPSGARAAALRAAALATLALEETGNLSVSVLVGQVRSTAADLLRGLGLDREDARAAVREAAENLG